MARQMLGAVNEFVAASARERLAHGRSKALQLVADDPRGARSCRGDPKLDAPVALLEQDPALERKMQTYVDIAKKDRPTYDQIARELRKMNKKWSVQKKERARESHGPRNRSPFSSCDFVGNRTRRGCPNRRPRPQENLPPRARGKSRAGECSPARRPRAKAPKKYGTHYGNARRQESPCHARADSSSRKLKVGLGCTPWPADHGASVEPRVGLGCTPWPADHAAGPWRRCSDCFDRVRYPGSRLLWYGWAARCAAWTPGMHGP